MLKSIVKCFKRNFGKLPTEVKDFSNQDEIYYQKRHAEVYAIGKSDWETKNELAKKCDTCYLGTRHTAFYGTYEEYQYSQISMSDSFIDLMSLNSWRWQNLIHSKVGDINEA